MEMENSNAEASREQEHNRRKMELEDKSKRSRKRRYALIPRFACMRLNDDVPVAKKPDVDGSFDMEASVHAKAEPPNHLIVLVNGIIGSAQNWRYAAKRFVQAFPREVMVHASEANSSLLTLDGIDVMGRRLADEVISVVTGHPNLQKISFIGHSLGGLIIRFAIAVLYQQDSSTKPSDINGECEEELNKLPVEVKTRAKIAGLEPMNFITSATPHLGSRGHKQVPILCGLYAMEKAALRTSWLLGRTGEHLFLRESDHGKPPLLLQMSNDLEDLKFISALQSFKRRVAYANARFDHIVGWSSSSLQPRNELPKHWDLVKDKYRYIFKKEVTNKAYPQGIRLESKVARGTTSEMEESMLRGLTRASWERVHVNFRGSIQRIFAHSTIQVKTYCINYHGANVIQHMIDNFEL